MAKTGKFSVAGLRELQKQLDGLQGNEAEDFMESCAKELAARLLSKVIKRTPVGQYPISSGKKGGTLRRGWTASGGTASDSGSGASSQFSVRHVGNAYVVEVKNPVEYASYVEFGHRTRGGHGWVEGRFMLTISEKELQGIAPQVLQAKLKDFLGGIFNGTGK